MSLIWITGAHGFIGRYLARHLSLRGHRVVGIGHGFWPQIEAARWGISDWMDSDITVTSLGQLRQACGIPEEVYHLAGGSSVGAAFSNPHEDFFRTVVSTAELLEWVRQYAPGIRLVAVSSAAVYGSAHQGPIAEDARKSPYSPYGAHKLIMEELCHSYAANFAVKVVVPRLFSVYGPGLKKQLLWDLCGKLAAGGPVVLGGTGAEVRDWTHVQDVVHALEQAAGLADDQAPVLNLATGVPTSVRDIAFTLVSQWSGAAAAERLSFSKHSRPGDPFSLIADVTSQRSHGVACSTPITQGLAEYVDWYRNEVVRDL